jgi:hypothetical protein
MIVLALAIAAAAGVPQSQPEAWARCIWDRVPQSAVNWLDMPVEKSSGFNSQSRYWRLSFRLQRACWDRFFPKPTKLALMSDPFDESLVRQALIRTRPAQVRRDKLVNVSLCQAFSGETLVAEYFGFESLKPYGGYRVTCGAIGNDGSLTHA